MARRSRRSSWGGWGGSFGGGWRPYVPVAERRRKAQAKIARERKKGVIFMPVRIEGRTIAKTPWGSAWCEHCESYGDYANRLPRGRTYVRNGSVVDLKLSEGRIEAQVMGSEIYEQEILIDPCAPAAWKRVKAQCTGRIGSLIELLEGRVSAEVMAEMIAVENGILPDLSQVSLACSCPDWAKLCKHLAAVLYGVGARLDEQPELLFTLRGVDPAELVDAGGLAERLASGRGSTQRLERDLSSVFGIDVDEDEPAVPARTTARKSAPRRSSPKRSSAKGTMMKAAASTRGGSSPAPSSAKREAKAASKRTPARSARTATPRSAPKSPSPPASKKRPAPKATSRKTAAKSAPARGQQRTAKITRAELLGLGLPAGTVSSWLRDGVLLTTAERGVYRHTPESRARLRRREP